MKSFSSSSPVKKILVISQFYYPDITAAAFRIKETVDILVSKGYMVHVITAKPHKAVLSDMKISDGNVCVSRVPIILYTGGGKWNYIAHYLSFMVGAIKASFEHPARFDIVWASSPPIFVGLVGRLVSWLKRAKFVLDIRDIWPDSAAVTGQLSKHGVMFKTAKLLESWLYKTADRITCVSEPMAKYIESYRVAKPAVIYNGVLTSYLDAAELFSHEGAESLQKSDILTIAHVGNMGYCQNLGLVIDAAEKLHKAGIRDVKFLLVGEGAEKAKLIDRLRDIGLKNVEILGAVSKLDALKICVSASALILLLKDDETMKKTIPSKVFDYLAAGRPILFGIKGEGEEILASSPANIKFEPTNADSLVEAVLAFKRNSESFTKAALEHRGIVKSKFTREAMTERLANEFLKLFQ